MKKIFLLLIILQIFLFHAICKDEVKIKTPFCYNMGWKEIKDVTWSPEDVQNSIEIYLYSGGLFKYDNVSMKEKNNYLPDHKCFCMSISGNDIFVGTESHGIYKGSYTPSTSVVDWYQAGHYLDGYKVNSMSMNTNLWLVCTNDGIHKSIDDGLNWVQNKDDININNIAMLSSSGTSTFFIGANDGIHKSTDGSSWSPTKNSDGINNFTRTTNILFYDTNNNIFYAGTTSGLYFSANNGENWSMYSGTSGWNITAIASYNDYIYLGTESSGFKFYNDITWSSINTNYPKLYPDTEIYYRINSLAVKSIGGTNYILAATDVGLKNDEISPSPSGWDSKYQVLAVSETKEEMKVKQLSLISNNLWITCYQERDPFPGATYILPQTPNSIISTKWSNFNCHGFAWHLIEGGEKGIGDFPDPSYMGHINQTTDNYQNFSNNEEINHNWDYVKTFESSDLWEKITYHGQHSGIRSANPGKIISKWGSNGPLVEHEIENCPYISFKCYWKSKKVLSGNITVNHFIGRQITTSGLTTIPANNTVQFYVAPMYNHKINFQPGFHAESGSNFHAYINTGCNIPWEEYRTVKISVNDEKIKSIPKNKISKGNLKLFISPNPSSGSISLSTKISAYDKTCPVNIKFYSFNGKVVKEFTLNNGEKTETNAEGIASGSYLISAETEYINTKGDPVRLKATEIIVIEK